MSGRQQAEQVRDDINHLLNEALGRIRSACAALSESLAAAELAVSAAREKARAFNRQVADCSIVTEDGAIAFNRIGPSDAKRTADIIAEMEIAPCAVEQGLRVKLSPSQVYKDYPRGSVITVPLRECLQIERDLLGARLMDAPDEEQ